MKKVAFHYSKMSLWPPLVEDYFSELDHLTYLKDAPLAEADLVFVETALCQIAFQQKLKSNRNTNSNMRIFGLGESKPEMKNCFDYVFEEPCDIMEFTKKISDHMPLPNVIDLLIADDDEEILKMVADYFEGRHSPEFKVRRAANGRDALSAIEKRQPDAMILDIKMPHVGGREVYCAAQKLKRKIPTIVFYDAISAGDLDAIKKAGRPIVVEKGFRESSMPYLMALIKKLVYFSS